MCRQCRKRFPHHRLQRKPLVSDPGMHHGTCVTHVPLCMSGSIIRDGGENIPGIPGACATSNFTCMARDPWRCMWLDVSEYNKKYVTRQCHNYNILWSSRKCYQNILLMPRKENWRGLIMYPTVWQTVWCQSKTPFRWIVYGAKWLVGMKRWDPPPLALSSLVTGEFPSQRPLTWSFDVFDLRLNKQTWGKPSA